MPNELVLISYFLMWYFLVGLAILFIVSGVDDLFIDFYYWLRYVWRLWKTRHFKPLTYEQLSEKEEQLIAVLVPCWQEANVIATMLKHNSYSIDYQRYYFFVGLYPNDPDTIAEVQAAASEHPKVQYVIGRYTGPTNKATNLNEIYRHVKAFEKEHQLSFSIFVFHDSEDVIHPLSFKFYNYLIPRKDMIQIPIFPLEVNILNFTHWLYADEFAENHTKNIIVRESIKGHVPSAGVGTAFSRRSLELLEDHQNGNPFAINSLTEDYRTSLALRLHQLKQIFLTQTVLRTQWKKRWFFSKKYVQKPVKELIATRALFPFEYQKAVRQKSRWIIGIVFQEWYHSQWPKEWRVRYTLAHDRKSFITHFINGFGYIVFCYWVLYSALTYEKPQYPSLQEHLTHHPWVWWLIIAATVIMGERLLQRSIATYRIYGLLPACLVIPRAFYGNILNLNALIRAYCIYFRPSNREKSHIKPLAWEKTEHHFPGRHLLVPYRKRLGDLLLEQGIIQEKQLHQAIIVQQYSGERLGQVLCRLKFITPTQLENLLSTQYQLMLISPKETLAAQTQCRANLPKPLWKWLSKHGVSPINFDEKNRKITLAITDPTNDLLLRKIVKYLASYQTQFMLIKAELPND